MMLEGVLVIRWRPYINQPSFLEIQGQLVGLRVGWGGGK